MIVSHAKNVSAAYLESSTKLELGRPETTSQNMILFVDASPETCIQAMDIGWNVHNLVFSDVLEALSAPHKYHTIKANLYGEWVSSIPYTFDCIYIGESAAYVEDLGGLIKKAHSLLKAHAQIHLTVPNCHYYKYLIGKSTRELLPWPSQQPQGLAYTKEELKQIVESSECTIKKISEEFDSLYYDENYSKWQNVNGIDCHVALPSQQEERKNSFVKKYSLILDNGTTEIISAANMVEGVDVDKVHKQVQAFLADGQTHVVLGMLDKIVASGRATDMTYNLYGIYFYYLGEEHKAYLSFIDAIQRNAAVPDYYLNLYDVAKKLKVEHEVITLLKATIPHFPELQAVMTQISE